MLKTMLDSAAGEARVVLGDYNQSVPRGRRTPARAAEALSLALGELQLATAEVLDDGVLLIDHLAHSTDLMAADLQALSPEYNGGKLSDHIGVAMSVTRRGNS
ncbi:MAG: hypothetical protein O7B29_06850 [Deltaproteobacteria bacterium]|nr:hypothetical protein [Deltaproteobacteria bacterium]